MWVFVRLLGHSGTVLAPAHEVKDLFALSEIRLLPHDRPPSTLFAIPSLISVDHRLA